MSGSKGYLAKFIFVASRDHIGKGGVNGYYRNEECRGTIVVPTSARQLRRIENKGSRKNYNEPWSPRRASSCAPWRP
jgi:hypothetical protein